MLFALLIPSYAALANPPGIPVAEQNFDAWGRARNPNTWTYSSIPVAPAWLCRGYTGRFVIDLVPAPGPAILEVYDLQDRLLLHRSTDTPRVSPSYTPRVSCRTQ
ncbi:MAG: hypothetical protein OHK0039_34720 [Bacteroidia bacterium]